MWERLPSSQTMIHIRARGDRTIVWRSHRGVSREIKIYEKESMPFTETLFWAFQPTDNFFWKDLPHLCPTNPLTPNAQPPLNPKATNPILLFDLTFPVFESSSFVNLSLVPTEQKRWNEPSEALWTPQCSESGPRVSLSSSTPEPWFKSIHKYGEVSGPKEIELVRTFDMAEWYDNRTLLFSTLLAIPHPPRPI